MYEFIRKLKFVLSKRDKHYLIGLVFFSILISIIETVGISIIMPFISAASNFSLIHSNEYFKRVYDLFHFSNEVDFIIIFGLVLISFYIFRSAINLFYFYLMARFSQGRYHLLVYRLFENYMGLSYHDFTKKNSSMLTKSIITEANGLIAVINALLLMTGELFVVIFLYSTMIFVNWKITLLLTVILLLNAIFLMKTVSIKLKKIGVQRAEIQKKFYEIINRTFGNFKLIKLNSNDKDTLNEFAQASRAYAQTKIIQATLQPFPRLFLEAIGFGLIAFIIVFLVWKYNSDIHNTIGVISMFVVALYRLMPSVNRIMSSYNQIMFNHKAMEIIHNDLMYDQEKLGLNNITFGKSIKLTNIIFGYEEKDFVLDDVSLNIEKGQKIAFVGESGSGKSTLVDLIIGLYRPIRGEVSVDNDRLCDENIKQWRKKIGYIPQSVYLFDGTVGDNVAFAREYDQDKINECLKKAKIYDFLKTKNGSDTIVGEGGILLSGGQKQRIAIARALYGDPDILVLDEATSALDSMTESEIMDEIYDISKDKTLIIIAHRLSTIERCEKVYRIENKKIKMVR